MKRSVMIDIDGTITSLLFKRPYEKVETFSKESYRQLEPFAHCRDVINGLYCLYEIIIVTGREKKLKKLTKQWLQSHCIAFDKLIFIKFKIFDEYLEKKIQLVKKFKPFLVIDDFALFLTKIQDLVDVTYLILGDSSWNPNIIRQDILKSWLK